MLRKQNLNLNGVRFVEKLNAYMYEREKRIFIICQYANNFTYIIKYTNTKKDGVI